MGRIWKIIAFLILIFSYSFTFNKDKQMLLLSMSFDNKYNIELSDTSLLNLNGYFKLSIDTVNISWLKYFKKKYGKKEFYYKQCVFNDEQLYKINQYNELKEYTLNGICVKSPFFDWHPTGNNALDKRSLFIIRTTMMKLKRGKIIITGFVSKKNQNELITINPVTLFW